MLLDKNLIQGKTFTITEFSKKFRIAKNKAFVKSALEELGGSWKSRRKSVDWERNNQLSRTLFK